MRIERTNSNNVDFIYLVKLLYIYLNPYKTKTLQHFNNIDTITNVIVIYKKNIPIACGAIRQYSDHVMELKRMFVIDSERGTKAAQLLLQELEIWAIDLQTTKCILETGRDMLRAIAFYKKNNYNEIDNYEPYVSNIRSICFEKILKK